MRYDKGRKDASRRKIMEVASERFRTDGIAATGLAAIMSDAGMTNGAFYPHFQSKADLVRESVAAAMEAHAGLLHEIMVAGGIEAVITEYLSPAHRDNPGEGCTLAALLPELARQPLDTRQIFADRFIATARELAATLPQQVKDKEGLAIGLYATLIGTLQLARTVEGTDLSDRILKAGADSARAMLDLGMRDNA